MGSRRKATLLVILAWGGLVLLLSGEGRGSQGSSQEPEEGAGSPPPQAVARGKQIYTEKACSACHAIAGEGGTLGPALDGVGQRRDRASILRKIADPKYDNPDSIMPATPMTEEERGAVADFLLSLQSAAAPPDAPTPPPGEPETPAKPTLVGSAVCANCHQPFHDSFSRTAHGPLLLRPDLKATRRGCEVCHGPGSAHVAAGGRTNLILQPAKLPPKQSNDLCLPCHQTQVPRQAWLTSPHSHAKLQCTSCHGVMRPRFPKLLKEKEIDLCLRCHPRVRAEISQNSHHPVKEGRLACSSCHDPHSGTRDGMLREETNSLCERCHADKQGPFAFEHPVISGGFAEGCLSCHLPHGAPNRALIRLPGRGVCLQCHTDKITHQLVSPAARQSCSILGCHNRIHGSSLDPLFLQ